MDGMSKNSKREQDMIKGIERSSGDAADFMDFMTKNS